MHIGKYNFHTVQLGDEITVEIILTCSSKFPDSSAPNGVVVSLLISWRGKCEDLLHTLNKRANQASTQSPSCHCCYIFQKLSNPTPKICLIVLSLLLAIIIRPREKGTWWTTNLLDCCHDHMLNGLLQRHDDLNVFWQEMKQSSLRGGHFSLGCNPYLDKTVFPLVYSFALSEPFGCQSCIKLPPECPTLFALTSNSAAQYELQQPAQLHRICMLCHQGHIWQRKAWDFLS